MEIEGQSEGQSLGGKVGQRRYEIRRWKGEQVIFRERRMEFRQQDGTKEVRDSVLKGWERYLWRYKDGVQVERWKVGIYQEMEEQGLEEEMKRRKDGGLVKRKNEGSERLGVERVGTLRGGR